MVFQDLRSASQRLTDTLLLLHLLDRANRVRKSAGYVKVEKLAYLAQKQLQDSGQSAFHYSFIKSRLGPFTAQIYDDIGTLVSIGALREGSNIPTEAGMRILENCQDVVRPELRDVLDGIARKYAKHSMNALVRLVHEMRFQIGERWLTIEELPNGTLVLDPGDARLSEMATLTDEWEKTLDAIFTPGVLEQIRSSEEDIKKDRVVRFDTKEKFLAHLDAL